MGQAAIFTVTTEVWPGANRAMVTNNSTVIIKVRLIDVVLIEFPVLQSSINRDSTNAVNMHDPLTALRQHGIPECLRWKKIH